MSTLGVITQKKNLESPYLKSFLQQALNLNLNLYLFTPEDLNLTSMKGTGKTFDFDKNTWVINTSAIPKFLYIDPSFDLYHKYLSIFRNLQTENYTFLNFPLPNRWILYDILKTNTILGPYFPKTTFGSNLKSVLESLDNGNPTLLKPVFSTKGKGSFILQQVDEGLIQIRTIKEQHLIEKNYPLNRVYSWLTQLSNQQSYVLQPYLTNLTENNRRFDLHILFQKDIHGNWKEQTRTIRYSKENGLFASDNGKIFEWSNEPFSEFTLLEIKEITNYIPPILETVFHPLVEVAIQITVDRSGAIWILDMNNFFDPAIFIEPHPEITDQITESLVTFIKHEISHLRKE